ncbi:conserved exported hypothetical protein [Hyphomicrobiales bacterium]|nr:conserved exported hypothetical protein [Hyphomicrobiales bacterium]CAH1702260.1 exported hypothetical protein [Hyphomicrobiales bacterium]CAI0346463.1 conserved exported hypothetical protein [Hyphomicrobiales bacterium]
MRVHFRPIVIALLAGLTGTPQAMAQEIFVRDLKCRADAISACVAQTKAIACTRGSTPIGGAVCQGPFTDTPDEQHAVACGAKVDNLQAGTCLVPVNLQTLINSSAILAELKETSRAIREDQRAMLNELCRAVGGKPDRCDETLPMKK